MAKLNHPSAPDQHVSPHEWLEWTADRLMRGEEVSSDDLGVGVKSLRLEIQTGVAPETIGPATWVLPRSGAERITLIAKLEEGGEISTTRPPKDTP